MNFLGRLANLSAVSLNPNILSVQLVAAQSVTLKCSSDSVFCAKLHSAIRQLQITCQRHLSYGEWYLELSSGAIKSITPYLVSSKRLTLIREKQMHRLVKVRNVACQTCKAHQDTSRASQSSELLDDLVQRVVRARVLCRFHSVELFTGAVETQV